MASVEMNCNLKKISQFFKGLMCILGQSLNTDFTILRPRRNHFIFPLGSLTAIPRYRRGSLSNIWAVLANIRQDFRDSALQYEDKVNIACESQEETIEKCQRPGGV